MLATLDLLAWLLKYCSILTAARLVSTVFNWEFGVSRQYLRLLELLFRLGERRIERVQSRHRCRCESEASNGSQPDSPAPGPKQAPLKQATRAATRRVSTLDGPPVFLLDDWTQPELAEEEPETPETLETPGTPDSDCNRCNNSSSNNSNNNNNNHDPGHSRRPFRLADACMFVQRGLAAVVDDQVTKRFSTEELKTWNLLTRTNAKNYHFMSRSLGLAWFTGFLVRYALLLPLRIIYTVAGFLWLMLSMPLVGTLPGPIRAPLYRLTSLMAFRMLSCGITSRLHFHNRQYRAQPGDICVANHTSPIDVVLLACDNCYALVGQRHAGLLGVLERALSRASRHVWFDRNEMRDRQLVTQRLREHASNKRNLPVLIFPEGTCINNSAVMLFKKGTFEAVDRVCPVAMKYDPRFGDPFWNSSKQSYLRYLLLMMSSWAIKCDVWYLPPVCRLPDESPAEFAGRVKSLIARQGGLVDLNWDGGLKRSKPKEEWKCQQQQDYARRLVDHVFPDLLMDNHTSDEQHHHSHQTLIEAH